MQYQIDAARTESRDAMVSAMRLSPSRYVIDGEEPRQTDTPMRLLHAALGLQTEAGEFADPIKKYVFYGKPIDHVLLEEELGDLTWYIALACNALGLDMMAVMEKNVAKLKQRYPEKFTEDKALNRDLDAERKILETPAV